MDFQGVLSRLQAEAANTVQQGLLFERLILAVLPQLPEQDIEGIWLWRDWPERESMMNMNAQDLGIDLVAKRRGEDGFRAIQCKFYDRNTTVAAADINSFLVLGGNKVFSSRLIISTTNNWSKNVETYLDKTNTQRLDFFMLNSMDVDWNLADPTKTKIKRAPKRLRRCAMLCPANPQSTGSLNVMERWSTAKAASSMMPMTGFLIRYRPATAQMPSFT